MRFQLAVAIAFTVSGCCDATDRLREVLPNASAASPQSAAPVASAPKTDNAVPAPTSTTPIPFAVGQWARYTITRNGAVSSNLHFKVVGKEGNAHWFEVVQNDGSKNTVIKFMVAIGNRADPKSYDLRKAMIRLPNGMVRTLSGMELKMNRKLLNQMLARIKLPYFAGAPQEDATTKAGTFRKCYVSEAKDKFFGIPFDTRNWNHTVVPISTLVRSVDRTDGAVMELMSYGLEGAKSEMK